MLIASLGSGCTLPATEPPPYEPVPLREARPGLSAPKPELAWRPPGQLAAFVHPHEDRRQGLLVGGHWIVLLLGSGSWHFEDEPPLDPVPDGELGALAGQAAAKQLEIPPHAVIPYERVDRGRP